MHSDPTGHRQRLRKRFMRAGFGGFAEYEIVELILTLCIPRRDVKPQAKALLARFGSLQGVLDATPDDLAKAEGMGEVAPVAIRIIRETANLYLQQSLEEQDALNSTDKIEALCRSRLRGLKNEVFEVLYLDKRYRLIEDGVDRVEEGTVDRAHVNPRKVMERALRKSALHLVIVHNHPSGNARPSAADVELTDALARAGDALGISVLDHIIIAGNDTYSFRRQGQI